MRSFKLPVLTALASFSVLTGCLATQSQLKHVSDDRTAQIMAEQTDRVAADNQLKAADTELKAAQDALRQELGAVKGDVQALRTELQTLRTDFGAKISMLEDGMHFLMPVNFAFDDATVKDQDHAILDRFAKVITQYYPGVKVTVEGFADPKGSASYNIRLSQRRAEAVKTYLASNGLSGENLATVGYGETRLVTPGAWGDQPGADLNRRVVFVVETAGQKPVALAQPESR
jgi:peptidoglycan-associated lipoprotein